MATAAPLLTKTTLFEARTGGYFQYRVPGLLDIAAESGRVAH